MGRVRRARTIPQYQSYDLPSRQSVDSRITIQQSQTLYLSSSVRQRSLLRRMELVYERFDQKYAKHSVRFHSTTKSTVDTLLQRKSFSPDTAQSLGFYGSFLLHRVETFFEQRGFTFQRQLIAIPCTSLGLYRFVVLAKFTCSADQAPTTTTAATAESAATTEASTRTTRIRDTFTPRILMVDRGKRSN